MTLYESDYINKGCTVEILYGEHRSFNGVFKEFKVVGMDVEKSPHLGRYNYFIVNVYGEHISFCQTWLRLIDKPGYGKDIDGSWKPSYLLATHCTCDNRPSQPSVQCSVSDGDSCNCCVYCQATCQ